MDFVISRPRILVRERTASNEVAIIGVLHRMAGDNSVHQSPSQGINQETASAKHSDGHEPVFGFDGIGQASAHGIIPNYSDDCQYRDDFPICMGIKPASAISVVDSSGVNRFRHIDLPTWPLADIGRRKRAESIRIHAPVVYYDEELLKEWECVDLKARTPKATEKYEWEKRQDAQGKLWGSGAELMQREPQQYNVMGLVPLPFPLFKGHGSHDETKIANPNIWIPMNFSPTLGYLKAVISQDLNYEFFKMGGHCSIEFGHGALRQGSTDPNQDLRSLWNKYQSFLDSKSLELHHLEPINQGMFYDPQTLHSEQYLETIAVLGLNLEKLILNDDNVRTKLLNANISALNVGNENSSLAAKTDNVIENIYGWMKSLADPFMTSSLYSGGKRGRYGVLDLVNGIMKSFAKVDM